MNLTEYVIYKDLKEAKKLIKDEEKDPLNKLKERKIFIKNNNKCVILYRFFALEYQVFRLRTDAKKVLRYIFSREVFFSNVSEEQPSPKVLRNQIEKEKEEWDLCFKEKEKRQYLL